jgi:hypothetical protein
MLNLKPIHLKCPYSHYEPCPIESPDELANVMNYLHTTVCPLGDLCDIEKHLDECRFSAAEILHCTNGSVDAARDVIWAFTRSYETCGGEAVKFWPMLRALDHF